MIKGRSFPKLVSDPDFLMWSGLGVCSGLMGVIVGLAGFPPEVWFLLICLLFFIALAFLRYQLAFLGFQFVLFAFFDVFGYQPLLRNPINVFLADGIVVLLVVSAIRYFTRGAAHRGQSSPITGPLVVNFFFGFVALVVGFTSGHLFNDVIGDFRRIFFYPLAAFAGLAYPYKPADMRHLLRIFLVALLIICGFALVRILTNQTWDSAQFSDSNGFRAIGYFTGVIVIMGLGLFYGLSLETSGFRKWTLRLVSVLLLAVGILSGYRLLAVLTLAAPLFVSYMAYPRFSGFLKAVKAVVLLSVLLFGLWLVVKWSLSGWPVLPLSDLQQRIVSFDFRNNVRYFAWRSAWQQFQAAPLVGKGIGHQFIFLGLNSAGVPHLYKLTTHNVLLTILYQAGIIAAVLFLVIHVRVTRYVWINLSKIPSHFRGPLAGMFFGYVAALTLGMFQPLFESIGAIVAFYSWTGLLLNILRHHVNEVDPQRNPG